MIELWCDHKTTRTLTIPTSEVTCRLRMRRIVGCCQWTWSNSPRPSAGRTPVWSHRCVCPTVLLNNIVFTILFHTNKKQLHYTKYSQKACTLAMLVTSWLIGLTQTIFLSEVPATKKLCLSSSGWNFTQYGIFLFVKREIHSPVTVTHTLAKYVFTDKITKHSCFS